MAMTDHAMSDHSGKLRFFTLAPDADGITLVTFNRPPVNAMSFEVYPELKVLADIIESTDETRVVVMTSRRMPAHGAAAPISTISCRSTSNRA
jgi:enoyl-CoA hydratase/carnithine racemase